MLFKTIKEEIDRLLNEEIITAYHGSPHYKIIGKFKKGKTGYLGGGIYFTDTESVARDYANKNGAAHSGTIYQVDIFMRNPLIITDNNPTKFFLDTIYGSESIYNNRIKKQAWDTHIITSKDIKRLYQSGYDGVIWKFGGKTEYVIYDPKDIEIIKTDKS